MNKLVRKNKKGFTLTEMIVVIAIIGILAAVMIPSVVVYVKKARQNAAYQQATAVLDVYETYNTEKEAGLIFECTHPQEDNENNPCGCENQGDNNYTDFENYYNELMRETFNAGTEFIENGTKFKYVADNKVIVTITLSDRSATYGE